MKTNYSKCKGFLQNLPNSEEKEILLYFGGYENADDFIRDQRVWQFIDVQMGWQLYPIQLPEELKRNATVMTLIHKNTCGGGQE